MTDYLLGSVDDAATAHSMPAPRAGTSPAAQALAALAEEVASLRDDFVVLGRPLQDLDERLREDLLARLDQRLDAAVSGHVVPTLEESFAERVAAAAADRRMVDAELVEALRAEISLGLASLTAELRHNGELSAAVLTSALERNAATAAAVRSTVEELHFATEKTQAAMAEDLTLLGAMVNSASERADTAVARLGETFAAAEETTRESLAAGQLKVAGAVSDAVDALRSEVASLRESLTADLADLRAGLSAQLAEAASQTSRDISAELAGRVAAAVDVLRTAASAQVEAEGAATRGSILAITQRVQEEFAQQRVDLTQELVTATTPLASIMERVATAEAAAAAALREVGAAVGELDQRVGERVDAAVMALAARVRESEHAQADVASSLAALTGTVGSAIESVRAVDSVMQVATESAVKRADLVELAESVQSFIGGVQATVTQLAAGLAGLQAQVGELAAVPAGPAVTRADLAAIETAVGAKAEAAVLTLAEFLLKRGSL